MLVSNIAPFYKARRKQVLAQMKKEASALLLIAPPESIRNGDVHHPYRQDSNLHYLTGFEEPESALLLLPDGRSVLFVRTKDAHREMWEGERYGVEGALKIFEMDIAYPWAEFSQRLPELLSGVDQLYYRLGGPEELNSIQNQRVLTALQSNTRTPARLGRGTIPIADPTELLGLMRLIKSEDEIRALKKSCDLSGLAHNEVLKAVRPGMNEHEIEALINYEFAKRGAQRLGYGSIVAGGKKRGLPSLSQQ